MLWLWTESSWFLTYLLFSDHTLGNILIDHLQVISVHSIAALKIFLRLWFGGNYWKYWDVTENLRFLRVVIAFTGRSISGVSITNLLRWLPLSLILLVCDMVVKLAINLPVVTATRNITWIHYLAYLPLLTIYI